MGHPILKTFLSFYIYLNLNSLILENYSCFPEIQFQLNILYFYLANLATLVVTKNQELKRMPVSRVEQQETPCQLTPELMFQSEV